MQNLFFNLEPENIYKTSGNKNNTKTFCFVENRINHRKGRSTGLQKPFQRYIPDSFEMLQ